MRKRKTVNPQDTEDHVDGSPPKKKRKFFAWEDIPELSLGDSLMELPTDTASFKGILWKDSNNTEKKPELYEPGQGEKVALLKDWREVFKTSHHRNDWFRGANKHNGPKEKGRGRRQSTNSLNEPTAESQENRLADEDYDMSYSPPPLAIDEMGKSLDQKKDKKVQPLRTTSHLQEVMAVEDISTVVTPPSSPEKENLHPDAICTDQKQTNYQKLLRVEIPTPPTSAGAAPSQTSRQRRRGRPKGSTSTPVKEKTFNGSASVSNKATANAEEDNNRRHSKRVASSPREENPIETKNDKRKRTRARSPTL
jgi:hypothetical protein